MPDQPHASDLRAAAVAEARELIAKRRQFMPAWRWLETTDRRIDITGPLSDDDTLLVAQVIRGLETASAQRLKAMRETRPA